MKKKILIIDDCLSILNCLHMILDMHHYDVEITQNGSTLLNNPTVLPDILLLDCHMPGMDAFSLLKQLKNNPHLNAIPILLMSGDKDIEKISLSIGANGFIAKPFNIENLLKKLKAVEAEQLLLMGYETQDIK